MPALVSYEGAIPHAARGHFPCPQSANQNGTTEMMTDAIDLIRRYYAAFNNGDMTVFLSLLADDVAHDVNQGASETGKAAFGNFMDRMNRHYRERIEDIVVMATEDGTRAAAEFYVRGEYLSTDEGLPTANGQTYGLRAGAFFEIRDNKVARVTNYYNLQDWIKQVGG
jgi:steroid delta-isomerase-like uncharacterized protein